MTSVGISQHTFLPLVGWDHVRQSIEKILFTEIGERWFRRKFGSLVLSKLDSPQNQENILDLYVSIAEALEYRVEDGVELGEPRYSVTEIRVEPGPDGHITFTVTGVYYPNGHKGDFTPDPEWKNVGIQLLAAEMTTIAQSAA